MEGPVGLLAVQIDGRNRLVSKLLPRETELKLICAPGAGDALLQSEVITARAVGPLVTRDLVATYYDTADRQLSSRRLSLRVRQEDGRRIQTLKTPPAGDAVLAERGEWQVEVAGGPDLSAFDDLPPELAISIAPADLQPLFTTKVHRKSLPVRVRSGDARHSLIEVSVDRGELQIADKASPLDEVELELVEGSPRATLELARALRRLVPLRIGAQSKSERGFLLVSGEPPAAAKAGWLELDRHLSVEAALGSVLRHCLVQALGNEAAAADGRNVEGVHQLRVALRRLRSALSLFREAMTERARLRWAAEARWLLGRLGPSRDLDVLLTELLPPVGETLQAEPSLDALLALAGAAGTRLARGRVRRCWLAARVTSCSTSPAGWSWTAGGCAPAPSSLRRSAGR